MNSPKLIEVDFNNLSEIGLNSFKHITISDERGSLNISHESNNNFQFKGFSMKESFSYKGAARGLHIQDPSISPQTKIIEVLEGTIYDFVFNINAPDSIYCFKLDANYQASVLVPQNFAHGFIALTDVRFRYLCLGGYDEGNEKTYNFLNSAGNLLNISNLELSDKDALFPELNCRK